MTNVVGDRFQITIDKELREQLGLQPGDLAVERVEGDRLVVEFLPRRHSDSLLGIFKRPGLPRIEDWSSVKERAWRARGTEIAAALRDDSDRHRPSEEPG